MQTRTDFYTASPDAMKAMMALETAVGRLSIELPLLQLVRLRKEVLAGIAPDDMAAALRVLRAFEAATL